VEEGGRSGIRPSDKEKRANRDPSKGGGAYIGSTHKIQPLAPTRKLSEGLLRKKEFGELKERTNCPNFGKSGTPCERVQREQRGPESRKHKGGQPKRPRGAQPRGYSGGTKRRRGGGAIPVFWKQSLG